MSVSRYEIELVIDALETEAERRMKEHKRSGNEFDWAYAEGLSFAIERLKELI